MKKEYSVYFSKIVNYESISVEAETKDEATALANDIFDKGNVEIIEERWEVEATKD